MGSREDEISEHLSDSDTEYIPQPRKSRASPRGKRSGGGGKGQGPVGPYGSSLSSSNSARQLWLDALKSGQGVKRKPTSTAAWTDTLRRTGVGITSATSKQNMESFSGLSKSQARSMGYSSTSHYLRQKAGAEKPPRRGDSSTGNTPRSSSSGRPAYKSQEEYYDEIIELKKQIQALTNDNSTLRLKARRIEEDNIKKEKQVEQLLDPSKNEDMRRTLGDRKQDTGTVIHTLKTKILKLEHQLKDREAAYSKLQSDLKTTKVDEMRLQMEAYFFEIKRLRETKTIEGPERTKKSTIKETPSRLKAMQETVLRMNEKNLRFQAENKSLKQDLDKLMAEMETTKEKQEAYEDMTKKELLSAIGKLEKSLDKAEESTSLMSDVESRSANVEGKITLEGTVAQRLDQLDKRETELIAEIKKKNALNKRLKDDRSHYRKKVEDKQKEIDKLKSELEELQAELDGFYDKDKNSATPRHDRTSPRASRRQQPPPSPVASARGSRRSSGASAASSSGTDRKVERFRQNHAAKTIQKQWRGHKQHERDQDEAAELLQSAMRNHNYRTKNLQQWQIGGDTESETQDDLTDTVDDSEDNAAQTIQSSFTNYKQQKGFISRKEEKTERTENASLSASLPPKPTPRQRRRSSATSATSAASFANSANIIYVPHCSYNEPEENVTYSRNKKQTQEKSVRRKAIRGNDYSQSMIDKAIPQQSKSNKAIPQSESKSDKAIPQSWSNSDKAIPQQSKSDKAITQQSKSEKAIPQQSNSDRAIPQSESKSEKAISKQSKSDKDKDTAIKKTDNSDDDEAIEALQAALRNHLANKKRLAEEEGATPNVPPIPRPRLYPLIKNHCSHSSVNLLSSPSSTIYPESWKRNTPSSNRSTPRSRRRALDSTGEEEDSESPREMQRPYSKPRTRTPSPRVGRKSPAPSIRSRTSRPRDSDEEDDSDDDIMIGGGGKKFF